MDRRSKENYYLDIADAALNRSTCLRRHNTRPLYGQFAYFALRYGVTMFIYNLCFPAVARNTDGTYLVDVVHAEVYATRSDGFGKTVVGVILVVREQLFPTGDKTRLRSRIHL